MSVSASTVRFVAYGGLQAYTDGRAIDLGPFGHRLLLAQLVAAKGRSVSLDDLMDAAWADDPPVSGVNQIHRRVGQIRRLLEPELPTRAGGRWLQSTGNGYRLVTDDGTSDLMAFDALLRRARASLSSGLVDSAAEFFAAALEVASSSPFADFPTDVLARPEFSELERDRVAAAIEAADVAIEHGSVAQLLATIYRVAAVAPFDEPLQARLIRALTAVGRRSDALLVFEDVRRRLADELGINPGPELSAAHQAVLVADAAPPHHVASSPSQLPAAIPGFVERTQLSAALHDQYLAAAAGQTAGVVAICGMAGVGKTALALHWAHALAADFPGGQLYINLRGFDHRGRGVDPNDALTSLLESMRAPTDVGELNTLDGKIALYRTFLRDRRMLIVLDNARDSEQVRPLLPGTPGCLTIVTSRDRLGGLVLRDGATSIAVNPMNVEESTRLLSARIGRGRVASDPVAAERIVEVCAGLPLALSLAAARATINPSLSLTGLAEQISDAGTRLDALSTGEAVDDARSAFTWSYRSLPSEPARAFRFLSAHPGSEIPLRAVASLLGCDEHVARRQLAELVASNMAGEGSSGHFVIHDLLRAFADELLTTDERDLAERRLIEYYVRSTRAAYLTWGRAPLVALAQPSPEVRSEPTPGGGEAAAIAWYRRERAALVSVTELAIKRGDDRAAAVIVVDAMPMSHRVDAGADLRQQIEAGLAAADRCSEPFLTVELERCLAILDQAAGDLASSERRLHRALRVARKLEAPVLESNVLRNLGGSARLRGDTEKQERYTRDALNAARRSNDPQIIATALDAYARVLWDVQRISDASQMFQEAADFAQRNGLVDLETSAIAGYAEACLELGHVVDGARAAERGLALIVANEALATEAMLLSLLATALLRVGDSEGAQRACDRFTSLLKRDTFASDTIHLSLEYDPEADSRVQEVLSALGAHERPNPDGRRRTH